MPHSLVRAVEAFFRGQGGLPDGLVVAVSGGPDSVALLRALLELPLEGPLVIAHLNHQLRGPESDADEAFVRHLCASLQQVTALRLELRCERVRVAEQARAERDNLESVARRLRYGWLAKVARESGARLIATGHTADDQAETVLHRLVRGSGLKGLRGIAARRPLEADVDVVRPLLHVTRVEVLDYLHALGQDYCCDRSNEDLRFTRNRIRHELLPLLETHYNAGIRAALARLAEQAATAYEQEESLAGALLAEAELPRAGPTLVLNRAQLVQAPRHLLREAFRLLWQREGWPTGRMSFDDWDRLVELVRGEPHAIDLPHRVRASRREGVVQLARTQ